MSGLAKPTIHLNGSSARRLLEENEVPRLLVLRSIEALERNGPNARDYYPQGQDAFGEAVRQHESRLSRLREVYCELNMLAGHIVEASGG